MAPNTNFVYCRKQSAAIVPSATLNVLGVASANLLTAPVDGNIIPVHLGVTTANMSTETVSFQATATWSDASTTTRVATATRTTNGNMAFAPPDWYALLSDGLWLVSLVVAVKSSINTSPTTATVELAALGS